jgi:hypothetical protein
MDDKRIMLDGRELHKRSEHRSARIRLNSAGRFQESIACGQGTAG